MQLDPAQLLDSVSTSVSKVISEMQETCDTLKASVKELPFCDPQAQYLQSWIDCVGDPDLSEFPAELLENTLDYSDDSLRLLDLPAEYKPPQTKWSDLAPQQTPPSNFYPTRVEHLLTSSALEDIDQWVRRSMIDLASTLLYFLPAFSPYICMRARSIIERLTH